MSGRRRKKMDSALFKALSEPYQDIIGILADSMDKGRAVSIAYKGHTRLIETHAIGMSTAGNPVIRAFQTAGYSEDGEYGWKMLRLDGLTPEKHGSEFAFVFPLTIKSLAPRPDYVPDDKGMMYIFKQL
jgi:hypothetical protein